MIPYFIFILISCVILRSYFFIMLKDEFPVNFYTFFKFLIGYFFTKPRYTFGESSRMFLLKVEGDNKERNMLKFINALTIIIYVSIISIILNMYIEKRS